MFERSRKVLDEMEKYDFEHERVIIFITDGRVQASEKQVKYEDTMKVSLSVIHRRPTGTVHGQIQPVSIPDRLSPFRLTLRLCESSPMTHR